MMKNLTLILTIAVFAWTNALFAQSKKVTGQVKSSSQENLIGVMVMVKGTTQAVASDFQGKFSISIAESVQNPVLVFTFLGYETQEIEVGGQEVLSLVMAPSSEMLSEVVVTAFGVSKEKRDLGYSTQTVDGKDLVKAREPNAIQGLAGKVAGVNIGSNTEVLGAPNVLIRGNAGVLYVVDGVPINSDSWNIAPDDIESYTVLKGPNAAALYGFRGQNGAIVINTKKGSKSPKGFSVELNSSTQMMSGWLSRPQTQSEYGNGNNYRYAFGNDPLDIDGNHRRDAIWGPRFEGQLIPQWDSPVDPNTGIRQGTPWEAKGKDNWEKFTRTGWLSTNNISVGSSTKTTDLRMSVTNTNQIGVFPNTGVTFNNYQFSGKQALTDKLRMEGLINLNMQHSDNFPDSWYGPNSYMYDFGVYSSAMFDIDDLRDYWLVDGVQQLNREYGRTNNPWFVAYEWLKGHRKNDMFGYFNVNYDLGKYSNVLVRATGSRWDAMRTERFPYSAENYGRPDRAGDYMEDRRSLEDMKYDFLFTFDREFSDFRVTGLVGGHARHFRYNSSYIRTNNLVIPGVYNFQNSENPTLSFDFRSQMMVLAAYTDLDFSYKDYVRVNATGHGDRLSTLPVGDQTYFYPSLSVSSILTRYLREQLPEVISFAKVRGSVAEVQGGLVSPFVGPSFVALGATRPFRYGSDWFTSYDGPTYLNQNIFSSSILYNNEPAVGFTGVVANDELRPFNVRAYETGLDIMFLKNRIGMDFTFFRTLNGPQIFTKDLAPSTGFYQTNINDVITRKDGFEVALKGTPIIKKDFKWNVMFNYASFVERFHEINDPSGTVFFGNNFYRVGDRVDEAFGTDVVRDANNNIIHRADGMPLRRPSGPAGATSLGFGNSDFAWAINNQFIYKNWTFSFQFDGRVGGSIFNELRWAAYRGGTHEDLAGDTDYGVARLAEWESFRDNGTITPAYVGPGVKVTAGSPTFGEDGAITNYDQLTIVDNDVAVQVQNYVLALGAMNGPWIQSKTHAKLREIVVTYGLPSKYLENSKLEAVNFSFVARNLLYFANFKDIDMDQYPGAQLRAHAGSDEGGAGGRSSQNPRLQSPSVRSFGINLNLVF